ncbi:hypothetical protein ILUMI_21488 [Ignelater luminosus]|uniref:Uncharacterized protein n=1 Tax=Ignelater luminosus TaxID=2038154 RepID=A0A8K0CFJ0_IGNLU|nr:hypothetical protein ILUMI_21488 [Ignelater luminosus]
MGVSKLSCGFFLLFILSGIVFGEDSTLSPSPSSSMIPKARALGRVHIPWLGLGPECTGCPQHYCDDDPAIIDGYCCGCARITDRLPVRCPPVVECPANTYSLCESYEYMMHCCCS